MTYLRQTFRVVRAYGDPPDWRDECDDWAAEFGEDTFLIFETRVATRMCPALDRLKTAAGRRADARRQPDEAEHVGNAMPIRRPSGIAIGKPSLTGRSTRR
jgi:hypothetical protein